MGWQVCNGGVEGGWPAGCSAFWDPCDLLWPEVALCRGFSAALE